MESRIARLLAILRSYDHENPPHTFDNHALTAGGVPELEMLRELAWESPTNCYSHVLLQSHFVHYVYAVKVQAYLQVQREAKHILSVTLNSQSHPLH